MGIHCLLAERITSSSSGNMLRFLTLAAALALAAGMGMDEKKIMKDMMVFNSMTACWGKGNMYLYKLALLEATEQCTQQDHHNLLKPANPILSLLNQDAETLPFQLSNNQARNNNPFLSSSNSNNPFKSSSSQLNLNAWNNLWGNSRSKRQAEGLLQPTEEDFREFLEDFEEFKGDMAQYTTDVWNKIDLSQTMAGEDPEWRNMLTTHYKDCYDIARSFPQSALNRNPLTKVFGRHMVFFKCAKKVEHKCCAMACANDMLETLYGTNDNYDWTQHNMPQNKYKRAALTLKIMYGTASDEEMAINDFFFGMDM